MKKIIVYLSFPVGWLALLFLRTTYLKYNYFKDKEVKTPIPFHDYFFPLAMINITCVLMAVMTVSGL